MKMSLIHYVKWSLLSFSIIFLNLIILYYADVETFDAFYFLSVIFILFIVFFELLLQRKLKQKFDYILIGILLVSILQITIPYLRDLNMAFIPSLLLLIFIIIRFIQIRKTDFEVEDASKKSFVIYLYFISYFLLALTLIMKSQFIYLFIGTIPLYLLSSYLMITSFKEFERKQFLIYISIVSLVLIYLSSTVSPSRTLRYDIMFNLEFVIVSVLFLPHLFIIYKITNNELEMSLKKKFKKVKK